MVDEVSSVELDCISAPLAIWVEEAEISSADIATARDETAIWVAISRRFFTICRIECSSHPISSRDWLRMSVVRSPLDTCSARMPRLVSGSAMSRARPRPSRTPAPIVKTIMTRMVVRESWKICAAAAASLPAELSRSSALSACHPSRVVSARTPVKPVRIFRRIVQSLIVCCQALPIVLILGRGRSSVQQQHLVQIQQHDQPGVPAGDSGEEIGLGGHHFFRRRRRRCPPAPSSPGRPDRPAGRAPGRAPRPPRCGRTG